MTRDEIYQQLNKIFKETLDLKEVHLTDQTTAVDVDGWDSFAQISLVGEIERYFKIKFSMNEIVNFKDVGAMVSLIQSKVPKE